VRTIINTVGTSLMTNASKVLNIAKTDEKNLFQFLNNSTHEQACAETNSITKLYQDGDRLIFLHSQTEEGKLCADVLCRHFNSRKITSTLETVLDLSYQERRFKMRGLRSLVNTIIRLILEERKKGRAPVLNATGGFKAEIAYATLIGLLFDVPVFYIHEAFREIIEMPATPISWDFTLLADHEDFFFWLDSEPRDTLEVDARLKQLPQDVRFLLIEEEGNSFLSPAGEVFFSAFTQAIEKAANCPVYLSEPASNFYEKLEPSIKARYEREIAKLRSQVLRRSNADQVRKCDCFVYPKGHRDERVFFYEKENSVFICELARHSDESYERLIARGVQKDAYKDFKQMS